MAGPDHNLKTVRLPVLSGKSWMRAVPFTPDYSWEPTVTLPISAFLKYNLGSAFAKMELWENSGNSVSVGSKSPFRRRTNVG